MTDHLSDYTADPSFQLGQAKELLRSWLDPDSLAMRVLGVESLRDRTRQFLAQGGEQGMGPDETAARTAVAACRIPWPGHATRGLYPGDQVAHPIFGTGRLKGFNDGEWPNVVSVVACGRVLVEFEDLDPAPERWVAVDSLTAVPGERDADWQAAHEMAEQTYLRNIETREYEGT